jgi:cytochrome c
MKPSRIRIPIILMIMYSPCALYATDSPDSPKAREISTLVDRAVSLLVQKGKETTFAELRQKNSEWFHDDVYVFGDDFDGTVILNPAKPELEGKNLLDAKDRNGKAFNRAMRDVAEREGAGWVDYWWPKPGAAEASHKWSYVRKVIVNGRPAFLGAGFYGE